MYRHPTKYASSYLEWAHRAYFQSEGGQYKFTAPTYGFSILCKSHSFQIID